MRIIPSISALSRPFGALLTPDPNKKELSMLTTLYMSYWVFDNSWYMSTNADLAEAIPSDIFPNGWHHFKSVGYFEGRLPVDPHVDDEWYMATYPDVAEAIVEGVFKTAREHFTKLGYAEGRLPCDPEVQPSWYAPRYLPTHPKAAKDQKFCTEHFVKFGYLNGALPGPAK